MDSLNIFPLFQKSCQILVIPKIEVPIQDFNQHLGTIYVRGLILHLVFKLIIRLHECDAV